MNTYLAGFVSERRAPKASQKVCDFTEAAQS